MCERINITLPPALLKAIDEICDYNMCSRSHLIRLAIRQYLSSLDDEEDSEK